MPRRRGSIIEQAGARLIGLKLVKADVVAHLEPLCTRDMLSVP